LNLSYYEKVKLQFVYQERTIEEDKKTDDHVFKCLVRDRLSLTLICVFIAYYDFIDKIEYFKGKLKWKMFLLLENCLY